MEYDVFIRDNLTEGDAVITALMYRDFDRFENQIEILSELSTELVKFSGGELAVGAGVILDDMLRISQTCGWNQIQILSDVGETELRKQIVSDPFEIQVDPNVIPALLHGYLYSENSIAADAEITGELQAVCPISCEDIIIGITSDHIAIPYLTEYSSGSASFESNADVALCLEKKNVCENKVSLTASAGIVAGRYRKLAEFDSHTLGEIDSSALDELDFEPAIQKTDRR